jgi:hypothetical protein
MAEEFIEDAVVCFYNNIVNTFAFSMKTLKVSIVFLFTALLLSKSYSAVSHNVNALPSNPEAYISYSDRSVLSDAIQLSDFIINENLTVQIHFTDIFSKLKVSCFTNQNNVFTHKLSCFIQSDNTFLLSASFTLYIFFRALLI